MEPLGSFIFWTTIIVVVLFLVCVFVFSSRWQKNISEQKDPWEIDRSSIDVSHKLGEGNFGIVSKGLWNNKGMPTDVAIKTFKGTMVREEFLAEAKVMKNIKHKNIVQLYGVCTLGEPVLIVTEFMNKGSLQQYLRGVKEDGKCLPYTTLVDFASQVTAGMIYLEKNNYIHRDLAARNVLINENLVVKISDFGLTRFLEGDVYYARTPGALRWSAPEAVLNRIFSSKSDVFSFGILLYEIFTYCCILPYNEMPNSEVVNKVAIQGVRMACPYGCPQEVYNIMRECWRTLPQQRPSFTTVKNALESLIIRRALPQLSTGASLITQSDLWPIVRSVGFGFGFN